VLDHVSLFLSRIGSLGLVWIVIALVVAFVLRRPWSALYVIGAVVAADLITSAIKAVVPRHRPFEHQIGPSMRTHSFPSGHTSTSFAAATMLAILVPRFRVAFFVLATLIGLSRLYNGVHYPTDVLAGALLGVLVALGIRHLSQLRVPRGGETRA
jgi:undecaprenyl-diphosphatase